MRYQTMDLLIKMSRLLQHKKLGTTFLVVNFHHVCLVRRCLQSACRQVGTEYLLTNVRTRTWAHSGVLGFVVISVLTFSGNLL